MDMQQKELLKILMGTPGIFYMDISKFPKDQLIHKKIYQQFKT
jgi:hypothetical protein